MRESKNQSIKIKTLFFDPGKATSMQKHSHRSEILFCRYGEVIVFNPRGWTSLQEGKYLIVKPKEWHRIEAGASGATLLEVQFGQKCYERDIERAS
jgi:quercetin dioxygenase-like cupin family protein